MGIRWTRRAGRWLNAVFLLAGFSLPMAAFGQAEALERFLDEEGRLSVPTDFVGSLDPSGFKMQASAEGAPRFVAGGDGAVAGKWQAFGGVSFGCNGPVHAVVVDASGVVYLGGQFDVCGDAMANGVVAYDPSTEAFQSLGSGVHNGLSAARVAALAVFEGDVYAGGSFIQAGDQPANNVARWDGNQWHSLGRDDQNGVGGFAISLGVYAFAVSGSDLYVGGKFSEAGGEPANQIARWDGGQWQALESSGENGVSGTGTRHGVFSLAVSGDDVYVGGSFTGAGDQLANHVARWDGKQWHALEGGDRNGVSGGYVAALAVSDDGVYVGGGFEQVAGKQVNRVARWDGSRWHALDSGGETGVSGEAVSSLVILDGNVFVGGQFTQAGDQPAGNVARWDGDQWHALTDNGRNGVSGPSVFDYPTMAVATTMAVVDGVVYVGGSFAEAGDQPASGVARWDGTQWLAPGNGAQKGVSRMVFALAASGREVYVGGRFNLAGDRLANHVAHWDGSQWQALGSGVQNGLNGDVRAVAVSGGDVYVGGEFTEAGGQVTNHIARWDGSHWHPLASGGQNGVDGEVTAIAVSGSDVYVGGSSLKLVDRCPVMLLAGMAVNGMPWQATGKTE
ncbi:Kelch repeat-containing protein [Wenzhouxiangella sp. EGI_FJ10409]|uniref:hypothetical protein n=1 Tax=Wenzhouxiangella sp. EGI_FJ10409 TaxID=3243767 RepID=UPI0035E02CE4